MTDKAKALISAKVDACIQRLYGRYAIHGPFSNKTIGVGVRPETFKDILTKAFEMGYELKEMEINNDPRMEELTKLYLQNNG